MSAERTSPKTPGDLDTRFGTNGAVDGPVGGTTHSVVSQPDGRLIYAVHSSNQYQIYRINADGLPDPSFGNNGSVTGQFQAGNNSKPTRLVSHDKKILIVGDVLEDAGGKPAAKRLNENGSPDLVFQSVVVPLPAFSSNADPCDGGVLSDGRVLILSQRLNKDFADRGLLTCWNNNGELDRSFGDQGHIEIDMGSEFIRMISLAVQDDDKFVIGMNYITQQLTASKIVLCRYTSRGKLDTSFGIDGYTHLSHEVDSYHLGKMITQPDGKLICVGNAKGTAALMMRYNANGTPDVQFNQGKEVKVELNSERRLLTAVGVQPEDDKIVVAGWMPGSSNQMFSGRLNKDGSLDPTFANNFYGRTLRGVPYDIVMQGDRFIIAGISYRTPNAAVLYGIQR
ncbi:MULTISPECIES: hypothetical protein [unclassified Pseudomonas]|uniref:hypothetical protein n=1 Tax=unclassified Pseudomonas TaxID=196821 RepID=UPI001304E135|nr:MULTISPECIES: hypothetical protein [unclassified Pseudomonas]